MGTPKPIRTEAGYDAALARIWELWDTPEGSTDREELDALMDLVEQYEEKHYPMGAPSPADAIEFRMDQEGLTPEDLAPDVGTPAEIADVLSGKCALTTAMAQAFHDRLGIPYAVLRPQEPAKAGSTAGRLTEESPRSRRGEG